MPKRHGTPRPVWNDACRGAPGSSGGAGGGGGAETKSGAMGIDLDDIIGLESGERASDSVGESKKSDGSGDQGGDGGNGGEGDGKKKKKEVAAACVRDRTNQPTKVGPEST